MLTVPKEEVPTFLFVGRLAANKRPARASPRSMPRANSSRALDSGSSARARWKPGSASEPATRSRSSVGSHGRSCTNGWRGPTACSSRRSGRDGAWSSPRPTRSGPAVGYDVPGIRDAIRPGRTGLLAPTGDAASLGRLAADLVLDRERYERMCAEAVTWGRCFSWDVTAELFLEIVHDRVRSSATRGMEAVGAELAAAG